MSAYSSVAWLVEFGWENVFKNKKFKLAGFPEYKARRF
jgi:hypothetical protein